MRLLRRNTTTFQYLKNIGEEETILNGRHTGDSEPMYDSPITYRGNISSPTGFATDKLFGIDVQYSHVLLLDKPDTDITEDGLIVWNGAEYEIKAVRPSLNVLAIALKKRPVNHAKSGE